ncbi:branched-chain amino acid ABC transporter permease [Methylobacterium sp. NEAU 140]|uniref:branched-chain amino acid ABC transporter permease n=1 Tax=Methylobacterium sp. NEAU 140 TaxID=3064945 RepID=UPI002734BA4A|nr:branched-chain amino acid ABC transporter permease [Methylobacterium sp. NEAU 140]MDP4026154.1 branched-chain amino acid ABC transporter permease [Methylobacterium sp. NEAU 140]
MSALPQLIVAGIGMGSIYALVALGLVLIYRTTNVVNFAQGDFPMVGAFLLVICLFHAGMPYWAGILVALAGMAVFGGLFNLAVYYPLRNRSYLPVLISTLGASIFVQNTVLAAYGPQPANLPPLLPLRGFQVGGVFLDPQYLVIIVVSAALVLLQYLFFEKTYLGKKIQATAQDKETASLIGIPVRWMIMLTFVYSAVLGGVAGILVGPIMYFSIGMGTAIALKAFAATIIGGFGDIRGAILGGLGLGIIENLGAAYISVPYKDAFAFLVLFAFLMVLPQGIFGEKIAEKA